MKFAQFVTESGKIVYINPAHVVVIHANTATSTIVLSDGHALIVTITALDAALRLSQAL